jgi:hypothetical protein
MVGRILVELPDDDIAHLEAIAASKNVLLTEVIGWAITPYIERDNASKTRPRAFGIWKDRDVDGLEYQNRMRREW